MEITGSCLCGTVRFALTGAPVWAHNCHCSRCRKSRGAAYASNVFVTGDAFRWAQGEVELQSYRPPDAERFTHAFCRRCGSSMPWLNEANGLVVVPMGALDVDPGTGPLAHIFVASKAPWHAITDELPQHPGTAALRPPAADRRRFRKRSSRGALRGAARRRQPERLGQVRQRLVGQRQLGRQALAEPLGGHQRQVDHRHVAARLDAVPAQDVEDAADLQP